MKNCLNLLKTLSILAFLIVSAPLFGATPYAGFSEIFPPDPAANQFFGFAVANTDDVAVIGASSSPIPFFTGTTNNGAVYVFVKTNGAWVFQQKLEASEAASQGHCVVRRQPVWVGSGPGGEHHCRGRAEPGKWRQSGRGICLPTVWYGNDLGRTGHRHFQHAPAIRI